MLMGENTAIAVVLLSLLVMIIYACNALPKYIILNEANQSNYLRSLTTLEFLDNNNVSSKLSEEPDAK